jgi:hypothetical protein
METSKDAHSLLVATNEFQKSLIEQARALDTFKQLVNFVAECLAFAERYIQPQTGRVWTQGDENVQILARHVTVLYAGGAAHPYRQITHAISSGSTTATMAFAYVNNHYSLYEGDEAQTEYKRLSGAFYELQSGPTVQAQVGTFLKGWNDRAQSKYVQALNGLRSLPHDEDAQGQLLMMRSAINLTMTGLLKRTPLTKKKRGDVKRNEELPTIAKYLARDQLARAALLDANDSFLQLTRQLAKTKDVPIPRPQADALMYQAVAVLKVIADSVQSPETR